MKAAAGNRDATTRARAFDFDVWVLALGYLFFYIPYSALAKALSSGVLPGMQGRVSGFELLPATIIGTAVTMPLIITLMGWWKHCEHRSVAGLRIPVPSAGSIVAGVAFAVIIATTTLAYTFEGISIVFALLLMRGGVLILAPIIDALFRHRVRATSWIGLGLSFVALAVALSDAGSYQLSLAAVLNLALYLSGYFFRLRHISGAGKSEFPQAGYRYFVEEQMVAMPVLLGVPALLALLEVGTVGAALRRGFTSFLFSDLAIPALLVGFLYAALGTFGTLIYLNRRENSFSIPVNRCSSLLSGVVATYGLMVALGQPAPRASQLAGAAIIVSAVVALGARTLLAVRRDEHLVLFLCDGNTARSPLAEAICNAEAVPGAATAGSVPRATALRALSAGLHSKIGTPMKTEARAALEQLGIRATRHSARAVTEDMVRRVDHVYCFTEAQHAAFLERYPEAAGKTSLLDPDADIDEPRAGDAEHFSAVARGIAARVRAITAEHGTTLRSKAPA